ncbi:hypothetical protein Cgig2_020532 [Carnegiea gigantea]|uniref:Regulator of Vps4 activity in the MVB pathway protein n=1 Tax=Carnegiea gigantea TaxID=171969 RepID=A0A9Q1KAQ8_9CARY|nr:hypothetical protein Cgig2_020532 [Carnegiea gigantea]
MIIHGGCWVFWVFSKSAVTRTKTRLDIIKKKKSATQKFLKEDIAELLKKNLYGHAYSRAEGLYMEMNSSPWYDYIEECCNCIADHLKQMHQQRECPEECKVAAASLIYATARFADLPELRDLRAHFNDKYGKSLEPFVSKEFVEKLKSKPPNREMKLFLMQDIAQEFSVPWDPKSLERQLQRSSTTAQDYNLARSRSAVARGKEKQYNSNKHIDEGISLRHSRSSREDVSHKLKEQYDRDKPGTPLFSSRSVTKDKAYRRSFIDGTVLAPYTIPQKSKGKEEQNHRNMENGVVTKPKPKSVITKLFKQSQSTVSSTSEQETDVKEPLSAKVPGEAKYRLGRGANEMGGEMTNGLFINYSKMEFPNAASVNSNNGQPVSQDLPLPPSRRRYLFPQPASLIKEANEIIINIS